MKALFRFSFLLLFLGACTPCEREVVILSTNDIHAHIEHFPRLATAVERCRDTAQVILVDAGDRWTGNAYVDLAEDRRPIIELMNRLGYDLATLGNHEFDKGQALLERSVRYAQFPIICANIQTHEGAALKPFEPTRIVKRGGVEVGFAAAVTNYGPNGHPDGHDFIFEGLSFTDAVESLAALQPRLAEQCDVTVALTHIGLRPDRQLAEQAPYHLIIGGHSHDRANEVVGQTLITQTGSKLRGIGVTTIRLSGDRLAGISYRLVPLEGYEPHPDYVAAVADYMADPALQRPVGTLQAPANRIGLGNLFAEGVRRAAEAEVGLYHYGGVRLDTLASGEVPVVAIHNLDPFASHVSTIEMTPAQLRGMIMAKYNDTVNVAESHRIDLFATEPYTIVRNAAGDAVDVLLPTLDAARTYRVAMGDYIFKTYPGIEGANGTTTDTLVTDALIALFADPVTPDNLLHQKEQ